MLDQQEIVHHMDQVVLVQERLGLIRFFKELNTIVSTYSARINNTFYNNNVLDTRRFTNELENNIRKVTYEYWNNLRFKEVFEIDIITRAIFEKRNSLSTRLRNPQYVNYEFTDFEDRPDYARKIANAHVKMCLEILLIKLVAIRKFINHKYNGSAYLEE